MTRMILCLVVSVVALTVAWLWAGRQLAFLLDKFVTGRTVSLRVNPNQLMYSGGGFVIDDMQMTFGQTNYLRANLCFTFDSSDRVILCACPSHNTFTLGPRTSPVDPSGRPDFTFSAEPGDQISFVVSLLPACLEETLRRTPRNALALRTRVLSRTWLDRTPNAVALSDRSALCRHLQFVRFLCCRSASAVTF